MFDDTIAAIATALSRSAISIVRLSGPDAIDIADSLFTGSLKEADSHTIHYGFIQDEGKKIDEVLVSVFRAPKTYTMEDIVEINCHGGPFITRKILETVLKHGARLAKPGEFTQRAFVNGRIDLSQAEAVEDMIDASSDQSAVMALYGIQGSIKKLLEPLIDTLMDLIANIEVNIDYPEYDDVENLTFQELLPVSKEILKQMDGILKRSKQAVTVKKGIDTVIVGKPNVGKSSLLNALLEEDKAIVTNIPGTTRDIVEGQILAGNVLLNLIDTAGLRKSDDLIESIGIEKSRQKLEEAQLVLVVLDSSRPLEQEDLDLLEATKDKKRIVVLSKSDLPSAFEMEEGVAVSSKAQNIEPLLDKLDEVVNTSQLQENALLTNERQIGLLTQARADMMKAIQAMENEVQPDLIEIDLVSAHDHLKEILGEVHREDLLDTLFSKFCLGK